MIKFNWAVEWRGPRGATYWTGPISEENAREIFSKKKPSEIAYLLKLKGFSGFQFREVIARTSAAELLRYENSLKDAKKRKAQAEKSIEVCKEKIKQLKKLVAV
jgi:hypothetical protein